MAEGIFLENAVVLLQKLGFFTVALPFVLIFAVVFAILEKSQILGDSRNTNAIVAFVVALLATGVGVVTGIIANMLPLIAVVLVVILSFLLIWGFLGGATEGGGIPNGLKIGIGIAGGLAVIGIFVYSAGLWNKLGSFKGAEVVWGTIALVAIIIAAIATVISGGKGEGKSQGSGSSG